MICKIARHELALLVRNDLSPADAAAVRNHLGCCFDCQKLYTELQAAMSVLDAVNTQQLEATHRSVLPKLEVALARPSRDEIARSRWRLSFRNTLVPCLVGVALFLIGIQLPDNSGSRVYPELHNVGVTNGVGMSVRAMSPTYVPVYDEPSWQSLEQLDRSRLGREPLRNVGY